MIKIDWSKAPSDATHHHPQTELITEHWYRKGFFCNVGFEMHGWQKDICPLENAQYAERPADQERSMPATAAFPNPGVVLSPGSHNPQQQGAYEGMSLRDYFAAKFAAAQAATTSADRDFIRPDNRYPHLAESPEHTVAKEIARISYALADAMLAERAK